MSANDLAPLLLKFPEDIIRDILEILARSDTRMALNLLVVSRKFHEWTESVLYDMVWLGSEEQADLFIRTTKSKPAHFFERVKILCLTYTIGHDRAAEILPYCTKLEGLACWVPDTMGLPKLKDFTTPRCLSLNLSVTLNEYSGPDFGLPLFSNVTHLEFLDDTDLCMVWEGFELMPCLTHLAFTWSTRIPLREVITHPGRALHACPQLKVLVLMRPNFDQEPATEGYRIFLDPRCVILHQPDYDVRDIRADWEAQWFGEPNMWRTAEEVAKMQASLPSIPPPPPSALLPPPEIGLPGYDRTGETMKYR
ncbi:hypothetical protein HGRIS_008739 [Hohenbuehelia grisea]|uniref:F-box domain-containing protein n=1 Tax=Hohenbuehelia grisea TaxID=104357 RepID=A0ABR3J9E4_9AGAR